MGELQPWFCWPVRPSARPGGLTRCTRSTAFLCPAASAFRPG